MEHSLKSPALTLLLFWVLLGGTLLAQANAGDDKPDLPAPAPKKLELPWTADQIKQAMKKGQSVKFKITSQSPEGTQVGYMTQEILEVGDKTYTIQTSLSKADGSSAGQPTKEEKNWESLTTGLEFTEKNTSISEEKTKVEAGEFTCKVYTFKQSDESGKLTIDYFFISDKPGQLAKLSQKKETPTESSSYVMELVEIKE